MSISRADVERVAQLAHIELTEADAERMARELSAVLDYMTVLARADASDDDAEAEAAPLREDRVLPGLSPADAVAGAPDAEGGLYKVPPMLSGGVLSGGER